MFRCVVPLQLVSYTSGLMGSEHLVQGPYAMYVQVISNQHHTLCMREVFIDELLELVSKAASSTILSNCYPPPTPHRLARNEYVSRTPSFVLVVLQSVQARLLEQGFSTRCMSLKFLAFLVQAHHWVKRIVRTLVHAQDIFHLGDEAWSYLGYAPTLHSPGLELVFFRRFITQVSDICSTYPSSTILSANNCNVHVPLPSGGVEQASITNLASASPSISRGLPERGLSYKAASSPPCTKSCLTLETVLLQRSRVSAMDWLELVRRVSVPRLPTLISAAINSRRARVCTRALLVPELISFLSVARSSSLSLISGAVFIPPLYHIYHIPFWHKLCWYSTQNDKGGAWSQDSTA